MTKEALRILLIGFGNPGRIDDGLGPALVALLEKDDLAGLDVDANYQLTVEDAAAVAEHDVVVFADAAETGPEPFFLTRIVPKPHMTFSTHSVAPSAVLGMAHDLFGATTEGWLMGIRGYQFDTFEESLSDRARKNLDEAHRYIKQAIEAGRFAEIRADEAPVHGRLLDSEPEETHG